MKYTLEFQSDIKMVKPVVKETLKRVKSHFPFISEEDESDLRLILSELLYNAAIHGNSEDIQKNVKLRLEVKKNYVYCIVADEGSGFDYKKFLSYFAGKGEEQKEAILGSDHGRGILLAVSLSDSLTFNSKGNEIMFSKYLGIGVDSDR